MSSKGEAILLITKAHYDNFSVFQFNVYLNNVGGNIRVITDGPSHIRQCLHPDSVRRDSNLPNVLNTFTDVR